MQNYGVPVLQIFTPNKKKGFIMFPAKTYVERRARLRQMLGSGIVILPGNFDTAINFPNNAISFRQDSTFLYFFGLNMARLTGIIDLDNGKDYLYGNDTTIDEMIWTGPQPSLSELATEVGVHHTAPYANVAEAIAEARRNKRRIHYLPQFRGMEIIYMSTLLGVPAQQINDNASIELMMAVTQMREIKSDEEIAEIEKAFEVGYLMHTTAMRMCKEGVIEREIIGAISGIAMQHGWGWSFFSHVTQHGEILHNFGCDFPLKNGRLLLCDAGAELTSGYCSDHTRTYPVSGKFSTCQREIYEIVLRAHDHIINVARPMRYQDLHNEALLSMARDLTQLGLLKGDPQEAVAAGAMNLLMPHGLGHGMGLDVHDCEAIGERGDVYNFDFSRVADKAASIACCTHRQSWQLRPNVVMSDEPGLYFIPALIEQWKSKHICKDFIDYDKLAAYYDFGGIRIEDDIIITQDGCRRVGGDKKIPVTPDELEAIVGH